MENITSTIILDTRKAKANGKYPLKLRITHNRKQKYYPIHEDLTTVEYESVFSLKPRKEYKELRDKLDAIKTKVNDIIGKLPEFSFADFENKLLRPASNSTNVFTSYFDYIEKLRNEGRIGTARSYECSLNSLKDFKPKLNFEDITVDFLYRYEADMLQKGKTYTTIGIYIRALRAIYNLAKEQGKIAANHYPFGKRKYEIPTGQNIKKALPLFDILRIKEYLTDTNNPSEGRARDFWLFSYLSNGINFKDITLLKFKNIIGDTLTFERAKTRHSTRSKPKIIKVHLLPELKAIIKKYGNKDKNPESYLFPVLKPGMTPVDEYKCIQQFIKNTNKYMKGIAKNLNIELPITTYYARHSYATVLRNSGASVEYISESLGHTTVATTANYLDSFEDDTRKKIASLLLGEPTKKKSKKKSTTV